MLASVFLMAMVKSGVSAGSRGRSRIKAATCLLQRARPVEAGPLVRGQVVQSHCKGFVGNGDDLNLGLGVCRGRGVCIINRLRLGGFRIHLCFDFRQGLAYYIMPACFRGCVRSWFLP